MDLQKALINEYKSHLANIEAIKNDYIKTHRKFSDGFQFEYKGGICTVVGATFSFNPNITEISVGDVELMIDFLYVTDFPPDDTVWYWVDMPKWRVSDKPELKVPWSQSMLMKVLEGEE